MRLQLSLFLACLLIITQAYSADTLYDARFKKWQTEAEQGDPKAQYSLGNAYVRGNEVDRDIKQAISWFEKAAKQGHTKSEYKLGSIYHEGRYIKRNYKKAFSWLSASARHGYHPAQFLLGKMYSNGQGTGKDLNKALSWLKKAKADQFLPVKDEIKKVERMIAATAKKEKETKTTKAYVAPVVQPKAKPKVKPKPKTKIAKKPKTKSATKTTANNNTTYDGLKLLLEGSWKDDSSSETTAYMPSDKNRCEIMHNYYISCSSSRQERTNKSAKVKYRVVSKFIDFTPDGKFIAEHQLNVIKVDRLDASSPGDIPKKGMQAKQISKCKFEDDNRIACVNDSFKRASYSR